MADIAEIGFKAETSSLEKASASLTKLKNAASGVSTATNKVDRVVSSTSVAVARAKTAEADATLKALRATKNATKADLQKASSALKTAKAEEARAKSALAAATANDRLARSTLKVAEAEKRQGTTRADLALAAGGVANDNIPNRFNTANVAAQFQDIGVTAAMGMNPLTIALQQGTQLSAILNSMKNPLKGLAAAFTSVINPVSLLSIGIVALVAGFIQVVDWTAFAKSALNSLADAIQTIGPYAIAAVAGLALFYSAANITGIMSAVKAIALMGTTTLIAGAKMAAAWVIANPVTLIAALVAAGAAVVTWAAKTIEPFRKFANVVIGIFKGMGMVIYGGLLSVFETINNVVAEALNGLIATVNAGLDALPAAIKEKLNIGNIDVQFNTSNNGLKKMKEGGALMANSLKAGFDSELQAEDYVGSISNTIGGAIDSLSDKFRGWASGIGKASEDAAKKTKDAWKEIVSGAERNIATLRAEGRALTMNSLDAAKLKTETKLLNDAKRQGIILDQEKRSKIEELSQATAELSEKNRQFRENLEFNKSTFKGFISDMRSDLEEGKSIWESFGNSVANVLNKISDRLLNQGIDLLFNSMGSFGGSGFGMFGGGGSQGIGARTAAFGSPSGIGPLPFAKGGAFTNGIVDSPTAFAFAKGGAFGVMGEAGPEAVMPLKRGPDGSLGVQVVGGSGESGDSVNISNNITVNVESSGNNAEDGDNLGRKIAKQVEMKIQQEMSKFVIRQSKSGGSLSNGVR